MWLLLLACRPPPTAPVELEDLCNFLFREAGEDEEREELLREGLANLDAWLEQDIEATLEGYTVDNLDQDIVDGLGITGYQSEELQGLDTRVPYWLDGRGPSTDRLVGAAVAFRHGHQVDGLALATVWGDQQEVLSGDYDIYERTWKQDPDDFMAERIDRAEASSYSEADFGPIQVTSRNRIQFRWVQTEDGPVLIHRSWLTEPAEVSWETISVRAQYLLAVSLPAPWAPEGAVRLMATWIDADYGVNIEDYARNQMVKSMREQGEMIDAWLDAQFAAHGDVEGVLDAAE